MLAFERVFALEFRGFGEMCTINSFLILCGLSLSLTMSGEILDNKINEPDEKGRTSVILYIPLRMLFFSFDYISFMALIFNYWFTFKVSVTIFKSLFVNCSMCLYLLFRR